MPNEQWGAPALSARELEIVRLVVKGRTNDEIAAELALSPRTVHSHLAKVRTKLKVKNRTALAVYALRKGLLPDDEGEQTGLDRFSQRCPCDEPTDCRRRLCRDFHRSAANG